MGSAASQSAGRWDYPEFCFKSEAVPKRGAEPKLPHVGAEVCWNFERRISESRLPGASIPCGGRRNRIGSETRILASPGSPREPFFKPPSPAAPSPGLPASPKRLDAVPLKEEREGLAKAVGSPQSMSSAEEEEEGDDNNDSPSSNSSRPLKVRIKTIKTSCGSITRTVTRISSDSEPGSAKGPAEQSPQETSLEAAAYPAAAEKEDGMGLDIPKEKLELSSPLKAVEGPKIVSVQLGNGTKIKGTVLPVSTIQSASSAMLIAASVAQQKSVVLPGKAGKAVAKNILNLVPQALPKADARSADYRCLECGDSFALEKSLARHYDRRSMRIEVTCNHCTKRLVFFNKCSLLLHAREHKDKGLVMQCSHLVMRPIALDQMIGQPDITPLVSVASFPAGKVAAVAQDAVAAANGAQELPILPLSGASEQSSYSCFRCLECKEQCKDKAGLAAHFQQAGTTGTTSSTNRPPRVCPGCCGNFLLANVEAHLKEACLHFSRRVGYRCPSCAVVFGGVNSIKSHIQTSHCEVFHKCPICPMAFKSAPSAHAHVYTQHPGFSNQQSKMIYKCAMCDTVFTHKPLLSSHFDQHLLNQRVSVFKCPDCPLLFAQKRTMLEHLKNTHQPQKPKEDLVKKAAVLLTPKQEPVETPVSKMSEDSSSSTEEDEPPSSPELRKTKRSRFQRQTSVKKFPCRLCERSFCSAPSLRRHVRVNHEGIKRVYPCRYCTEGKRTFSSRLILEKHIQVRHGIKVTDQTKSQEVVIARIGTGPAQQRAESGLAALPSGRVKREAKVTPGTRVPGGKSPPARDEAGRWEPPRPGPAFATRLCLG
ncbi:PREDICTED: LOW QUALITY PROTEIN: zinc finger protein 687 [Tinamus guttatus]|nr:PREDICTED: LOW QUALITY PROTEIN: zinc finger protein 687 [Tinamus guttatus]